MAGPRYLLTRTVSLGGGRSQLWFLIDNHVRRVVTVWGDPPSDQYVAAAGAALALEQDVRPVDATYHLGP